jgi:hypothetical protein
MSKINPAHGWAIVAPAGIIVSSVKPLRANCIESWAIRVFGTDADHQQMWQKWRREGYRCIKVTVIPRSEDGDE